MKMPTEVKKSRRHPLSKPPMRSPLSILKQDPTTDKGVYLSLNIYIECILLLIFSPFKISTTSMEGFPTAKGESPLFIKLRSLLQQFDEIHHQVV